MKRSGSAAAVLLVALVASTPVFAEPATHPATVLPATHPATQAPATRPVTHPATRPVTHPATVLPLRTAPATHPATVLPLRTRPATRPATHPATVLPLRSTPAAQAPATSELEGLLPPGARQLLSGVRIFSAMGARNRVYREAGAVQRDLRTYYEDRIATAQQQLLDRVQLGLEPSQLRAYVRVKAKLEAELAAALDDTEFEKRAAKYGFESVFRREMTAALVRVPRIRAGLEEMRSAVEELQATIGSVQTAIESGNPISAVTAELDEKLGKVERFGAAMAVISGQAGERILTVTQRIRDTVAPVQDSIDEAAGAAGQAIGELENLRGAISEQLDAPRSPRAGLDVLDEDGPVLDRIAAATGARPAVDAIAGVIGRQATQRSAADGGARVELARMRDRVRAAVLGRTLERIEGLCGQLVGALRRAALEAAAAGDPPPDSSSPCTTYGNPAALQALIDAERAESGTPTTSTPAPPGAPPSTVASEVADEPPSVDVDPVVAVEGQLTAGPVVEGAGLPTTVVDNRLEFVLSFADGVITGEGVVDREIDGSNDDCLDRYVSPLSIDFQGGFTDGGPAAAGTFEWRVDEGRYVQLELVQLGAVECEGRTSFGSGAGEWTATWDPATGTLTGSMVFPGGLGTNSFELDETPANPSE